MKGWTGPGMLRMPGQVDSARAEVRKASAVTARRRDVNAILAVGIQ